MRDLKRNQRTLYYALRTGETANYDEYGNETGESTPTYGKIMALNCNVSASVGEDAVNAFGSFTNYSRTIIVGDTACPMDEESIVWFGVPITEPHNYIVTRKADSKNNLMYALREVTVRA